MNILQIKDELDTLRSLIETCSIALRNKENSEWEAKKVSETLFFVALPFIDKLSEGL